MESFVQEFRGFLGGFQTADAVLHSNWPGAEEPHGTRKPDIFSHTANAKSDILPCLSL